MKPLFTTDMPDPDVIRVGDTYYMVSTTMFLMPGAPILSSKDLIHWEIISYVFTTIDDHENYRLENGKHGYGKGQWATSLTYRNGRFYVCFVCHDMGKTFIYSTDDPTKTGWDKVEMDEVFHDMSFLFWEDKAYLVYDNGDIKIVELNEDLSGVKEGGLRRLLFEAPSENIGLRCEGCRALVKDGMIYLFFIDWPKGGVRREVCYRSTSPEGPYESKVVFEETLGREGRGIAQGTLIDDGNGNWYAMFFQDRGASGRIPFLFNAKWENGWPVIEHEPCGSFEKTFSESGLFSNSFLDENGKLHQAWQWNHNPLEDCYSLTDVPDGLRLKTGHIATGLLDARNTITQRTIEPGCTFIVKMDCSHLKDGDYAGVCAFQGKYGQLGISMKEGGPSLLLKQKKGTSFGVGKIVPDVESEFDEWSAPITVEKSACIFFKIRYEFGTKEDLATFYYSFDGETYTEFGAPMQMIFTLDMFIGYRAAIFCYATKKIGGYIDVMEVRLT